MVVHGMHSLSQLPIVTTDMIPAQDTKQCCFNQIICKALWGGNMEKAPWRRHHGREIMPED